eukprot:EST43402.1 Hypothetical protein SS50377_16897 [Spironucleus salmonicida]
MSIWDHMRFVQKVKSKNNTIAIAITLDTANLQISKYQMTFILTPITQYQHTDNLYSLPPTLLFQANYVQNYSKDYYLLCKEDSSPMMCVPVGYTILFTQEPLGDHFSQVIEIPTNISFLKISHFVKLKIAIDAKMIQYHRIMNDMYVESSKIRSNMIDTTYIIINPDQMI